MEKYNYYSDKYMERYSNSPRVLEYREQVSLKMIKRICSASYGRFCDVGCGDGFFLSHVVEQVGQGWQFYGGEYSDYQREKAATNKNLIVEKIDLEGKLHYDDNFFDMVYSGEVIEHLYNPDQMIAEVQRVLKKGGYFLVTTPNMNSWLSRLLFPLGIQPINYECSTVSSAYGYRWLKRIKRQDWPVGHVRLFNAFSLTDLLEANGFEVCEKRGAGFEHIPRGLRWLDRIFAHTPALSSGLVFLCKKI